MCYTETPKIPEFLKWCKEHSYYLIIAEPIHEDNSNMKEEYIDEV